MPGPEAAPGITRVASTQNISTPACTLQHFTLHITSHITIAIITVHTILCGGCHEHEQATLCSVDIIKYLFYIYRDTWIQVSSLVYIYMATRVQHECLQGIFFKIIVYNYYYCVLIRNLSPSKKYYVPLLFEIAHLKLLKSCADAPPVMSSG